MTTITVRSLKSARPKKSPYFIRDDKVRGFAAKVNPSGRIKFIAEVRHENKTVRKTFGEYPLVGISDARNTALTVIQQVRSGTRDLVVEKESLRGLFNRYIAYDRLKPNTRKNYREAIFFYLSDWLDSQ